MEMEVHGPLSNDNTERSVVSIIVRVNPCRLPMQPFTATKCKGGLFSFTYTLATAGSYLLYVTVQGMVAFALCSPD